MCASQKKIDLTNKRTYIPALGYDWLTKFYDLTVKITMPERKFRNKLIKELNPIIGEEILEFGFGTGQNLIIAKQNHPKTDFTGLDIDPKVKRIAEQKINLKGLEIPLILYNGETFPFGSSEFDKVYSSLVFHHLDTQTKKHCLNEIKRILKPQGTLLIGDWGKPKSKFRRLLFYIVQLFDGFKSTQENVEGLLPIYMSDCGFEDVKEVDFINTKIGVYCYYEGKKPAHNTV